MNPQDPFGAFSPNTIRSNNRSVSLHYLFGLDPPQQINPESLITPPTDWSLWHITKEGGVFGITSSLDPRKEFHFNITTENGHFKITPAPDSSSGEALAMLLRVSSSDYNGSLQSPYPTLVLNGPGIDVGSPLRIRIVNRDTDLYDIYCDDHYSSESSMGGGVAKSVRRHSRKLYSRRRVYKKRVSMKRRCRRSRRLSRRSRSRSRKN
jgi:hypothetical protein